MPPTVKVSKQVKQQLQAPWSEAEIVAACDLMVTQQPDVRSWFLMLLEVMMAPEVAEGSARCNTVLPTPALAQQWVDWCEVLYRPWILRKVAAPTPDEPNAVIEAAGPLGMTKGVMQIEDADGNIAGVVVTLELQAQLMQFRQTVVDWLKADDNLEV